MSNNIANDNYHYDDYGNRWCKRCGKIDLECSCDNLIKEASLPVEQIKAKIEELEWHIDDCEGAKDKGATGDEIIYSLNDMIWELEDRKSYWLQKLKEENNISQLQEVSPDSSEGGSVVHFLLGKNKPFGIDTVRRILNQFDKGEISMSKIVEELNIAAYRWLQEETFELNVRLNAAINLNKAEVLKSIKENPSFTMQDFEKGLMLAGLVKPANEQEQKEFELLNQGSTPERSAATDDHQGDGDGNKNTNHE